MSVAGVSKRFRIYHQRPAGLKERVLSIFTGRRSSYEELWALRNISLELQAGETLGVIGANGSGKSTLLQVIAGIYVPDEGTVTVNGRLRALLELGSGFNPELTGRENVFLNGQLLGFRRSEVVPRFDAIVEFAELERFIDMPLKTYSSGMQMRLGFSVATHLDPEVLILDEVLAVGDDHFQRKCLRRILDIRESGAAVLFISHDLGTVEQICDRVALLTSGELTGEGEPAEMVSRYQALLAKQHAPDAAAAAAESKRWGSREVAIASVCLQDEAGAALSFLKTGETLRIVVGYEASVPIQKPVFGIAIRSQDGTLVTGPNTKLAGYPIDRLEGCGRVSYSVASLPLLPGTYRIAVAIYDHALIHAYDHWEDCAELLVIEGGTRERFGVVTMAAEWTLEEQ